MTSFDCVGGCSQTIVHKRLMHTRLCLHHIATKALVVTTSEMGTLVGIMGYYKVICPGQP